MEFFAQSGTHTAWNTGFRLIGDTANGGLAVSTPPDGASGGGAVISTNLQSAMLGSKSSAYSRSTFTLANTAAVNALDHFELRDGLQRWFHGLAERDQNR